MKSNQQKYFARLEKCIPINSLVSEAKNIFVQQAQFSLYKEGETIFSIGDTDDYYLYLVKGEIELLSKDNKKSYVNTGHRQSLHPIANLKPRMYRALVTQENTVIAKISSEILDKLLIWEQSSNQNAHGFEVDEVTDSNDEDQSWKMAMLQTQIFLTLPAAKISALFQSMEKVVVKAGQQIISQGEEGDYYYIIKSGRCRVSRHFSNEDQIDEVTLNELVDSECFGEEALVSGEPRNANVTMLTDGELMRLSKEQFQQILQEPIIHKVDPVQAKQLIKQGAISVDVRMEEEYNFLGIKNTINIPLYLLRIHIQRLDKNKHYILFCDTGARSSAAAFLMTQYGFKHVFVLNGGLESN